MYNFVIRFFAHGCAELRRQFHTNSAPPFNRFAFSEDFNDKIFSIVDLRRLFGDVIRFEDVVQPRILSLPIITEVELVGLILDLRDFFGLSLLGEPLPNRARDNEPFFRPSGSHMAEAIQVLNINEAIAL